jgi:hypothetical protein
MAGKQDDHSRSEDRFGRQDAERYSAWSSLVAVIVVVIVIGLVFFFSR